ncbi:hypothetical protein [Escherichia coli]|uniref:hypothetical protein n=1 Tax=Escherichia coli TaxID=562 RepID=UPI00069C540C|nr:hypothetical protein [Escherichia coli]EFK3427589.1 hypothetical protein [Escherichia coli]EFN8886866.1 hypothetical protein [Escherichia coli]EGI6687550.1 hypothetical protein [Escherichia coli]EHX9413182.1 hypothetical protein [Escherichia coli]EIP2418985.1 hypothetical protein [Escherichia coli]
MMSDIIIIGYQLSAVDNHAYFFDDAPDNIFCDKCGCCIDNTYLPEDLKTRNKCDIGYTYDGRPIVSLKFKEYIEGLVLNVDFFPVNKKQTLFLMKPKDIVSYTAYKKKNYCDKCHQYHDQVMPDPTFYDETGCILEKGMFFTSESFGSGKEKSPSIILGIETAKIISDAIKIHKFRGADISKITARVG